MLTRPQAVSRRSLTALKKPSPLGVETLLELGLRGLHCGSGQNLQNGWLNTDLYRFRGPQGLETSPGALYLCDERFVYLEHDATTPFPMQDAAVDWVFSEHFIEHIPPTAAIDWLREMRRVLKPGGHLRLSTPDLRKYMRGYLEHDARFFKEHAQRLAEMGVRSESRRAWFVNQIFHFWGHQWLYDVDELRFAAEQAGFVGAAFEVCAFRQGRIAEVTLLDRPIRNDESLYVEMARLS